jgi:hypothetical protein
MARAAPPTVACKQQREINQEQAKKRNAPGQLVGCSVVRTAIRAEYIHSVGSWLRRIVREKLSSGLDILICNLDAHSTNGVGVEPVHLDEMLILHVCRNTCRPQPSPEEVGLFGFAKCGDRLHAQPPLTRVSMDLNGGVFIIFLEASAPPAVSCPSASSGP